MRPPSFSYQRAIILPLVDCVPCLSTVLLFAWIETSNEFNGFDWWVSLLYFHLCKGSWSNSHMDLSSDWKVWWHKWARVDKVIVLQLVDGRPDLGSISMLSTPQLLYLPSLLSLTLRPNLAQQEAFSVLPVLLFRWLPCSSASFAYIYWCLHQLVFMILVHEPWCLGLTSSLYFFLLSSLGFLRLWRQKQCPISACL